MSVERTTFFNTRLILISLVLFSLGLRIPAIFIPHIENDEVIYQTLADKVTKNFLDYSLQGTAILEKLPKLNYDHPIFHRPPLFVYLLALFRSLLGKNLGILLPLLSGTLTLVIIFLLGREIYGERKALLATLILSLCPTLLFASTRILIDSLLTLLVSLTVFTLIISIKKRKVIWYIFSGLIFGLAVLTKETAFLVLPTCLYLIFKEGITTKKIFFTLCLGIASFLIFFPWLHYFYRVSGTFFPSWAKIYEENLKMFPFVRMSVHRPWYFYFLQIILITPVYIFGYFNLVKRIRNKGDLTEVLWILSYFIVLTIHGLSGQGYQTRYILPAIPALSLLSADIFVKANKIIWMIGVFLLAYGFLTGILNSILFKPADLFSILYFFKYAKGFN